MVNEKKNKINSENIFIFLFLVLFPFGQLIRIGILHPVDIIAGMGAFVFLIKKYKAPEALKYLSGFWTIAAISWVYSALVFKNPQIFYGLMYLIRLLAFIYFFGYAANFTRKIENSKLVVDGLLLVSAVSAFFGWLQYYIFPDLKPMFIFGWDMHLYRLAGTFFDPGFLGIIIVFGLAISLYRLLGKFTVKYFILTAFFLFSLAYTYSRASFLAFFGVLVGLAILKKKIKPIVITAAVIVVIIGLLPTSKNKSIELLRSFSAFNRIQNYADTVKIFKHSPVIGIGYNNMCLAYRSFVGYQKYSSHACSGSDSSLLLILATTGITGLIIFIYSLIKAGETAKKGEAKHLLILCFLALLIHSVFNNSMFYPWVMGYLLLIFAAAI